MTPEEKLNKLKILIDEGSYPFYEDDYLLSLIETNEDIYSIARTLCFQKASVPEIKLGDVTIKPPKDYFYNLAASFRNKYLDGETGEVKTKSSNGKVVLDMMAGAKYYISVIKQMIDQDKHTFNISRDEKVEDGYGGFITVNKEIEFEGRIYNRKSVREITDIQGTSIGLSAVSHEKLLTLSDVDIRKGDVLEFEGRTLRVKFANDYFNICKQIELEVIEDG